MLEKNYFKEFVTLANYDYLQLFRDMAICVNYDFLRPLRKFFHMDSLLHQ